MCISKRETELKRALQTVEDSREAEIQRVRFELGRKLTQKASGKLRLSDCMVFGFAFSSSLLTTCVVLQNEEVFQFRRELDHMMSVLHEL
jgi:hypothetical protein